MSSVVHFKFVNSRESEKVLFEGAAIPLESLKKAIIELKGGKLAEARVDLVITDAQTRKEFAPGSVINQNAAVLVKIKPPPAHTMTAAPAVPAALGAADVDRTSSGGSAQPGSDGSVANVGLPAAVLSDGAHPRFAGSGAPGAAAGGTGEVPHASYVCHMCGAIGQHLGKNCPGIVHLNPNDASTIRAIAKPGTGLPTGHVISMDDAGALAAAGAIVTTSATGDALGAYMPISGFAQRAAAAMGATTAAVAVDTSSVPPPAELSCPLCSKLLRDAISMPCCSKIVCDDCARTAVVASGSMTCPLCGEPASPDDFTVAKAHRAAVAQYLRTGQFVIGSEADAAAAPAAAGVIMMSETLPPPAPTVTHVQLAQPAPLTMTVAAARTHVDATVASSSTSGAATGGKVTMASKGIAMASAPTIPMTATSAAKMHGGDANGAGEHVRMMGGPRGPRGPPPPGGYLRGGGAPPYGYPPDYYGAPHPAAYYGHPGYAGPAMRGGYPDAYRGRPDYPAYPPGYVYDYWQGGYDYNRAYDHRYREADYHRMYAARERGGGAHPQPPFGRAAPHADDAAATGRHAGPQVDAAAPRDRDAEREGCATADAPVADVRDGGSLAGEGIADVRDSGSASGSASRDVAEAEGAHEQRPRSRERASVNGGEESHVRDVRDAPAASRPRDVAPPRVRDRVLEAELNARAAEAAARAEAAAKREQLLSDSRLAGRLMTRDDWERQNASRAAADHDADSARRPESGDRKRPRSASVASRDSGGEEDDAEMEEEPAAAAAAGDDKPRKRRKRSGRRHRHDGGRDERGSRHDDSRHRGRDDSGASSSVRRVAIAVGGPAASGSGRWQLEHRR